MKNSNPPVVMGRLSMRVMFTSNFQKYLSTSNKDPGSSSSSARIDTSGSSRYSLGWNGDLDNARAGCSRKAAGAAGAARARRASRGAARRARAAMREAYIAM